MQLRRWASFAFRPIILYPFLTISLSIYFSFLFLSPKNVHTQLLGVSGILLFAFLSQLTKPKLREGNRIQRRRIESAVSILAAIDLFTRGVGFEWAPYIAFPAFLIWVYLGFKNREVLFLLLVEVTFRIAGREGTINFSSKILLPLILLSLWVGISILFRLEEKKKRRTMQDRLHVYEREAITLENQAEEMRGKLLKDEKKKEHLAQTIREREKSFESFLEIIWKSFSTHTVAFYLYDPNQEVFILKDQLTESDRFADIRVQPLQGIFLAASKEQNPVRIVSATAGIRGLTYYSQNPEVRSVLAIPLRSQGLLKGIMIVDRLEALAFSEQEIDTLELIGIQIVKTIDSSEAIHAYFDLMEELGGFYSAVSSLNRCLHVEDVVRTLLESTHEMTPYDLGMVILFDASTETNRIVAEKGGEESGFVGRSFSCSPERGLVSWVIKNQAPLYYTDYRTRYARTPLFHKQLRVPNYYDSVFMIPLHLKGESIGVLLFMARKGHAFSKSIRKMLEVTSLQAAASLKNARMVDQLEKLATTDGLTGLVNHRTFQETLASEMERAGRHPAPVSLLLVDIDYFKKFNDEFGHPVGDFVLREIAQVLRRAVRKVDTVARYGGEEFAVILINTDPSGAFQLAQRMVAEVARSRFQNEGLSLKVTLSMGVASYPGDSINREELIEFADRALYEAKRSGRNRAIRYERKLGKMNAKKVEEKMIEAAESELRRMAEVSSA